MEFQLSLEGSGSIQAEVKLHAEERVSLCPITELEMTSNQDARLSGLISAARTIASEVEAGFGDLTRQQLNWKPGADQWSVAQCFDHLVTSNGSYFPVFDMVLSGKKENTFWESVPWLPALWGKMLIKAVSPESTRKQKAPNKFQPSSSSIDDAIVRKLINQQNQIIEYLKATEGLDLDKIKISSPVTNVISYSLMDAYKIIVTHEKRHLLQATRVTKVDGFPKGNG